MTIGRFPWKSADLHAQISDIAIGRFPKTQGWCTVFTAKECCDSANNLCILPLLWRVNCRVGTDFDSQL